MCIRDRDIINRLIETYRRIRNTLRFLHANINDDFNPKTDAVRYEKFSYLDKWMMSRLNMLIEKVLKAYNNYSFHAIYHSLHNFCAVDLSALYLDIVKDRIYVESKNSTKRRASQTVMFETLVSFVKLLAPVLSYTAEEMWLYLKGNVEEESVFLTTFPRVEKEYMSGELEEEWSRIWELRELINKKIEEKRVEKVIGHSLDTKVIVTVPEKEYLLLNKLGDELKEIVIVSQIELRQGNDVNVAVMRADGEKCQRCWQYTTAVSYTHLRAHETVIDLVCRLLLEKQN